MTRVLYGPLTFNPSGPYPTPFPIHPKALRRHLASTASIPRPSHDRPRQCETESGNELHVRDDRGGPAL